MSGRASALVSLCALALCGPVGAEAVSAAPEPETAEAAIARLASVLEHDASLSPELKRALLEVVRALGAERAAQAPGVPLAAPAATAPVRRFQPAGDFRYRHETTDPALSELDTRHRERLRVRAGLTWRPSAQLEIVGQLQTGERDEPKSPHVTLGNAFRNLPVNLSLASLSWQPKLVPGLRVMGGKFASPLVTNPVFGEVVWDADVRPEGAGAAWSRTQGSLRLAAATGYYIVQERSAGPDPGAFVAQGSVRAPVGTSEVALALGYYGFNRTTSRDPGTLLASAPGHSTLDTNGDGRADRFATDFRLWHPIAWLRINAAGRPLTIAGEYVKNAGAPRGRDTAWTAGLVWGAPHRRGDWQAYYQRLDVEPDAVFALVSQDDFPRASDFSGHLLGARVQLFDGSSLHAWALASKPRTLASPGADWRFRVDLNFSY